jgi:hypothetical protein
MSGLCRLSKARGCRSEKHHRSPDIRTLKVHHGCKGHQVRPEWQLSWVRMTRYWRWQSLVGSQRRALVLHGGAGWRSVHGGAPISNAGEETTRARQHAASVWQPACASNQGACISERRAWPSVMLLE